MKQFIILILLGIQVIFAQAPKKLSAVFEVAGQDSGALLGTYVKGVGDLNKDGYADVAVSAPGKLLTYIYYGGITMSQTPSLTLQGGGTIVSGDFNGDGWIDLAIEKYAKDTVFIYFGGATIDTIPDVLLHAENRYDGFGNNSLGGGDINGDGIADLIIGAQGYPYTDTITNNYWRGKIYVYAGGTTFDTNPTATFLGDTVNARLGADLAIGDVNNDGKKDIIALGYNSFSVFLGNTTFQLQRNYYIDSRNVPGGFSAHITSFDADGDGIDDILVNKIYIFKGRTQLDTLPTYYVAPPNNDTTNFGNYSWVSGGGDFNRDGFKDILVSRTEGYPFGVPGVSVMLGRLNHPGQYVAYRIFSDYWWISPLYGRPENAGDVNGDGVDDIIIGSPNEFMYNEGFFGIYSGDTSLVTEVKTLPLVQPNSFELQQNYPNPFNPETKIEYSLTKKDRITVKIYDALGREIITLINNEEQAAGSHILYWRGTDGKGNQVSTGIYYYQLKTPKGGQTKKAVYLK